MSKHIKTVILKLKRKGGSEAEALLPPKDELGASFVDAVIAIAIISIAFTALLEVGASSIKLSTLLGKKTDALLLAQENIEAVRSFRDGTDWANDGLGSLLIGSPYHAVLDTGTNPATLSFAAGEETAGIFTRKIIIDRVSRAPITDNIESPYNPANEDGDTRKVTVTVEWENNSLQLIAYFTNWK